MTAVSSSKPTGVLGLLRPWAGALALWVAGALSGHRIMIAYADLDTLMSMWGHLMWVAPSKFVQLALVVLCAALLYKGDEGPRTGRYLLAVLGVPVLVLVQDVGFLVADSGPDYLFFALREAAAVAGAGVGYLVASRIQARKGAADPF
ncbi:hypothetical protein [Nocardiopsis suaedae]|uniref:DoxX family protein n=1 Tax=Nocardiopsis suaedae TaxID=3018444 RepID=A0ABT4TFQ5_9ACTN|nr:hypothetical protein [Nocardiopsis suaedae]MDA2803545.1 hypothetical protein [Nocardiopsis suaedae]